MAYLDRADVLLRVKDRLNRPASDTAFTISATDDVLLRMMSEAQDEITKLIATYMPDIMRSVPTALTTADLGKTYTFGTDVDSANYFALGFFSVFAQRSDIPDFPLEPGVDFMIEGTTLRTPNNSTRSYPDGGPWAQFIPASNVITSSTQPTIPVLCRLAMVERTAEKAAKRIGLDPAEFQAEFDKRWLEMLGAVRTQATGKYGATIQHRPRSWWAGRRRF